VAAVRVVRVVAGDVAGECGIAEASGMQAGKQENGVVHAAQYLTMLPGGSRIRH